MTCLDAILSVQSVTTLTVWAIWDGPPFYNVSVGRLYQDPIFKKALAVKVGQKGHIGVIWNESDGLNESHKVTTKPPLLFLLPFQEQKNSNQAL